MRTLVGAWNQFWFAPQSTSTLALVRITYGIVTIGWTLSVLPDIGAWYSDSGVSPSQTGWRTPLTVLAWWDSSLAVAMLWAVTMFAALCLTLGARTRIAAFALLVALMSFHARNPDTINSGDTLLRLLALYLFLAPAGAAVSLDRRRTHPQDVWHVPRRAPWALRLIQVQVAVLYLFSVFYKVRGDEWADGTAYGYIARLSDVQRLALPGFATDSVLVVGLLTYGTLAVELALAVLIWNRRARPWVIAAGIALHLGIELTMTLGFFSLAILVGYVAFVPPDVGDRVISSARTRWTSVTAKYSPRRPDESAEHGVTTRRRGSGPVRGGTAAMPVRTR